MGAEIGIVKTAWSGTTGGPGLTQTAFKRSDNGGITGANVQAAVNAVRAFWDGIKAYLPNEVTLTVQPVVDIYDDVTGQLSGSTTAATPPAAVTGTDAGTYAMAAGLKANLHTGVIRNGRRVRGAIFIVPAGSSANNSSGTAASAAKTQVNTSGATLLGAFTTAGLEMKVWSRPTTTTSNDGDTAPVISVEANEKLAILRGRRD